MKTPYNSLQDKAYFVILGMLFLLLPFTGKAQKANSNNSATKAFAVIKSVDNTNTYFTADLMQLPTFFEKAFFLDLIFSDNQLVVDKSILSGASIELFSSLEHDPSAVLVSLKAYQEKAIEAETNFSAEKKAELLKKYDKFR